MVLHKATLICFSVTLTLTCGCDDAMYQQPLSGPVGIVRDVEVQVPTNGFLGLTFQAIDQTPLIIDRPVPGSGAEEAGVQSGDLLINVSGQTDPTLEQIHQALGATTPGDVLMMTVSRDGKELPLRVRLLSFEEMEKALKADQQTD